MGANAFGDQAAGVHQHARRHAFVQAATAQRAGLLGDLHQPHRKIGGDAAFMRHHLDLDLARQEVEVDRAEALARRRLHVLRRALVAGVVRNDEAEVRVRLHHLTALVERQHAPAVGQRVDHHRRVLARFDDLVEVADGAVAHRQGQRAVVPDGALRIEQEAADQVGRRHVFIARQRDQRQLHAPRHVLDKARLAAARRAFQHHRQAARDGGAEQAHFVTGGAVVRLAFDQVGADALVHGELSVG